MRRLVSVLGLVIDNRNKSTNSVRQFFVAAFWQLLVFLFTQHIKVSVAKTVMDLFGDS